MRKVLNFVNDNKKVIIVVVLIIILVGTIYFLNKASPKTSSASKIQTEMSATELKLTKILSCIEGVGDTEVMVNEGKEGVVGVVIVCEGGDNLMTKSDILNAVSTALKIDKKIIAIYSMN